MNQFRSKATTVLMALALFLGLASFGHAAGAEIQAETASDPVAEATVAGCPLSTLDGPHGHGAEVCPDCLNCSPVPPAAPDVTHSTADTVLSLLPFNPPLASLARELRPPRIPLV